MSAAPVRKGKRTGKAHGLMSAVAGTPRSMPAGRKAPCMRWMRLILTGCRWRHGSFEIGVFGAFQQTRGCGWPFDTMDKSGNWCEAPVARGILNRDQGLSPIHFWLKKRCIAWASCERPCGWIVARGKDSFMDFERTETSW